MMKHTDRYHRQLQLPGFGPEKQEMLSESNVVIIGAGGLGVPAAQYLAGAGVGRIIIVDHDKIEISNLHRQPLYTAESIGKLKSEELSSHLQKLNPEIIIESKAIELNQDNAKDILENANLVLDCSDNFKCRYLINDTCIGLNIPFISAAVYRYEGQFGVFNYKNGPSYRCFSPHPPQSEQVADCNSVGVIGTLPGIMGTFQANEAIKILTESDHIVINKVLLFNSLNYAISGFDLERNEAVISATLSGQFKHEFGNENLGIDLDELRRNFDTKQVLFLDVRQPEEKPDIEMNGISRIPLGELRNQIAKLNTNKVVICFCQSGIRSLKAAEILKEKGFQAYSLNRGIADLINETVI